MLDPHNGCDCIPMKYAKKIYPEWATEKDMFYAIELGKQDIMMSKQPWEDKSRDFDGNKDKYDQGKYDIRNQTAYPEYNERNKTSDDKGRPDYKNQTNSENGRNKTDYDKGRPDYKNQTYSDHGRNKTYYEEKESYPDYYEDKPYYPDYDQKENYKGDDKSTKNHTLVREPKPANNTVDSVDEPSVDEIFQQRTVDADTAVAPEKSSSGAVFTAATYTVSAVSVIVMLNY